MLRLNPPALSKMHRFLSTSSPFFKAGRRVLVPEYPLKTKPGKSVSIELAEYSDLPLITEYSEKSFSAEEPLSVALGVDPKVMNDQLTNKVSSFCLDFPFSTLAFDGDKLVAYIMVSLDIIDGNHPRLPKEIPEDFGPLFEKYANKFGITDPKTADITGTVWYACDMVANFLPEGEKHIVAHGEMGSVMKEYTGNNLVAALIVEGAKHIASTGLCDYYYGTATAAATAHLNPQLGLREVWSLKVKDISVGGRRVYKQDVLHEGADRITINLGKIQDVANTDYLNKKGIF
ncbi:unnamed protein product [Bursaphelenchus xylophilus]|uniref:(pine wood nematode) hypothetical protein n=1 Tax=Bursaphelenchus xylophilus TaxID=6326 RepID=A0A1I7SGM0_BURXY|nr:unnamed protein product [Bursaphelenchus xylophilus]CAG9105528.1 unnamed protein product [Bursaphelenchus xylophilus]